MSDDFFNELVSGACRQLAADSQLPLLVPDYPLSLRLRGHMVIDQSGKLLFVDKQLSAALDWMRQNACQGAIVVDDDGESPIALLVPWEVLPPGQQQ